MCLNHTAAYGVAKRFPKRVLSAPHQEGYYYHYHPTGSNHNNLHIWFYGQNTLDWEPVEEGIR